jgi:hypothetical protein
MASLNSYWLLFMVDVNFWNLLTDEILLSKLLEKLQEKVTHKAAKCKTQHMTLLLGFSFWGTPNPSAGMPAKFIHYFLAPALAITLTVLSYRLVTISSSVLP